VTVFATNEFPRTAAAMAADWPLPLNQRNRCDGRELLAPLQLELIPLCIFGLQYRGLLDKIRYGNEGVSRRRGRSGLLQMSDGTIGEFIAGISAALIPSGHLFLWVDKSHLCTGVRSWVGQQGLEAVDLVTWNKARIGMGYRTRRVGEYLPIMQQPPKRAEGVWPSDHIPQVVTEKVERIGQRASQAREASGAVDRGCYQPWRRGARPRGRQLFGDDRRPPSGTPIPRLRHRKRVVTRRME